MGLPGTLNAGARAYTTRYYFYDFLHLKCHFQWFLNENSYSYEKVTQFLKPVMQQIETCYMCTLYSPRRRTRGTIA